jgi:hypothetical protein
LQTVAHIFVKPPEKMNSPSHNSRLQDPHHPSASSTTTPITYGGNRHGMIWATSPKPPPGEDEAPTWRYWMFGDYHSDSHRFFEHAYERTPKEIACAAAASLLVSPIVSIIDKCIVQDISCTMKFTKAMVNATKEMIFTPRLFFGGLSFRLTTAVYFGTYAVANLSELALDIKRIRNDEQRKQIKVSASAVANISLLAWRDSVFAREFSASTPKHATPMRTFGLFAVRDASTMYATFYVAPSAAEYLQNEHGVGRNTAELSTALGVPVIAQFLTAPLHIHAMDYYAQPHASTAERWATIRREFGTVAFARGFRILPAFGIGSFSNNRFREYMIRHDYDPEPDPTTLTRRVTRAILGDTTMKKEDYDD